MTFDTPPDEFSSKLGMVSVSQYLNLQPERLDAGNRLEDPRDVWLFTEDQKADIEDPKCGAYIRMADSLDFMRTYFKLTRSWFIVENPELYR